MSHRPPLSLGFFVTPEFTLLDLSGALEPFHLANWLGGGERYRIRVLSASGGLVRSSEDVMVGSEPADLDGLDTLFDPDARDEEASSADAVHPPA